MRTKSPSDLKRKTALPGWNCQCPKLLLLFLQISPCPLPEAQLMTSSARKKNNCYHHRPDVYYRKHEDNANGRESSTTSPPKAFKRRSEGEEELGALHDTEKSISSKTNHCRAQHTMRERRERESTGDKGSRPDHMHVITPKETRVPS